MSGPSAQGVDEAQLAGHALNMLEVVYEALGTAIAAAKGGQISLADLAALATPAIRGDVQPSPAVVELCRRARQTREALDRQSAGREAALEVLKAAAGIAELVAPFTPALIALL